MKACVYTVLTGAYERFNEQPLVDKTAGIPFICFTDDPRASSAGWEFRPMRPLFVGDPVRSQREVKIRPHRYLPEFDLSLYLDNSVLLTAPPDRILARYGASGLALPRHSYRRTVLEEFAAVLEDGLDEEGRVLDQFEAYRNDYPRVLSSPPFWCGILLRRHNEPALVRLADLWSAHVHRYSRRDQLSINVALEEAGVVPSAIGIDNRASWFHAWPRSSQRKEAVRRRGTAGDGPSRRSSIDPLIARQSLQRQAQAIVSAQLIATGVQLGRKGIRADLDVSTPAVDRLAHRLLHSFTRCENGQVIFLDLDDNRGKELWRRKGNIHPEALHLWNLLLSLDDWTDIIDVGANYGEMLANVQLPPTARVVACEPNTRVLPYLRCTLARLPSPIELVEKAVSSRRAMVEFSIDTRWSGTSLISDGAAREGFESIRVEATTLEAILAGSPRRPAERRVLVKVDVEGREPDVVAGLGAGVEDLGALALMVETRHLDDEQLGSLLARYDLHLFELDTQRLVPLAPNSVQAYRRMTAGSRFHDHDAVLTLRRPPGPAFDQPASRTG